MAENTYTTAVGRRKTATARVKVTPAAKSSVTVNGKPANEYFNTKERDSISKDALLVEEVTGTYEVVARVSGGGISAQAEAVRHAISRALTKADMGLRAPLKAAGFLKRDPRAVERKKPGLRKARKRPQWSKR
ncbi:MAG TPA: 30S ribosomal protein S9 [Candidatus Paceibacterota bacterium]|nr:30S ribosomal protein S9 [Candidatus Paceibacterota bacterium]